MKAIEIIQSLMGAQRIGYERLGHLVGRRRDVVFKMLKRGNLREGDIERYGRALGEDIFYLLSSKARGMEAAHSERITELMEQIAGLTESKNQLVLQIKELEAANRDALSRLDELRR